MNSRKRSRWITFAAVTAVAVGAVAFWPGEKEPEYQGKKTSQWIEQYRSGQEHERAVAAIHAIGTNALPLLVRWLKHVPWHQRQGEIFLAVLPVKIQEELSLTGWEHNSMAVRGFEVLGPQAAPAIPALCQLVASSTSDEMIDMAVMSLAHVGEPAVPGLKQIMVDPRPAVRLSGAVAIGNTRCFGTNMASAARLLIEAVQDSDPTVGAVAAHELQVFSGDAQVLLPVLVKALDSADLKVRCASLMALQNLGTNAAPAIDVIITHLSDPDLPVRPIATNALRMIEPRMLTGSVPWPYD